MSGRVGGGRGARVISGGGAFVWPVIQEASYLTLEPMQIPIELRDALSHENIRVSVPSVCTVAIGDDETTQLTAARRLLNRAQDDIIRDAKDIIFGVMRSVIAGLTIEQINRDRDGLLTAIQTQLEPELQKIGLVLINVNITDVTDDSGYIEAIGRKAASQAVQQANADVAEQEKLGQTRVAEAQRDRAVSIAHATRDQQIGLAEATQEQDVKVGQITREREVGLSRAQAEQAVEIAEIERQREVARQQKAFEKEAQIAEAAREKRVKVAQADAAAQAGEAQSQAIVAEARSELDVRRAAAMKAAETAQAEARAAVETAQNRAQAEAARANAERVEAERRAEVEAPAKAEAARVIVAAEAAAEQVRLAAAAEADATRLRLEAQATGQAEILRQKAEALGELIQKAGGAEQAFLLLMQEQLPQLAQTAADAIKNIKIDKVVVWEGGNGTGNALTGGATSNFIQNMARSMPPMMDVLGQVAGVKLPDYLGTKLPDGGGGRG